MSRKTLMVCDRCGRSTTEMLDFSRVTHQEGVKELHADLCISCGVSFHRWLRRLDEEQEEQR